MVICTRFSFFSGVLLELMFVVNYFSFCGIVPMRRRTAPGLPGVLKALKDNRNRQADKDNTHARQKSTTTSMPALPGCPRAVNLVRHVICFCICHFYMMRFRKWAVAAMAAMATGGGGGGGRPRRWVPVAAAGVLAAAEVVVVVVVVAAAVAAVVLALAAKRSLVPPLGPSIFRPNMTAHERMPIS